MEMYNAIGYYFTLLQKQTIFSPFFDSLFFLSIGPPRYQVEASKSICTDVCSDTSACCGACCFFGYSIATLSYRMGRGFCMPWCCPYYIACCLYDDLQNMMGLESEGVFWLCVQHYFCYCCVLTKHLRAFWYYTLAGMPKHSTKVRVSRQGVVM
jgi:hypothetical protein